MYNAFIYITIGCFWNTCLMLRNYGPSKFDMPGSTFRGTNLKSNNMMTIVITVAGLNC